MLKKIFFSFIALLILLFAYYFTTKESKENLSNISKQRSISETVSQIKERQKLKLAIKKIYEEAGEELSRRVQTIIGDAKEDMDFVLALKPSQVRAINQQISIREKSNLKKSTTKLKYMALPDFRK